MLNNVKQDVSTSVSCELHVYYLVFPNERSNLRTEFSADTVTLRVVKELMQEFRSDVLTKRHHEKDRLTLETDREIFWGCGHSEELGGLQRDHIFGHVKKYSQSCILWGQSF